MGLVGRISEMCQYRGNLLRIAVSWQPVIINNSLYILIHTVSISKNKSSLYQNEQQQKKHILVNNEWHL